MEMGFRWDFAYEILPNMLWATLNTILAAGIGYAIAAIIGFFAAILLHLQRKYLLLPPATMFLRLALIACSEA